MTRAWVLRLFLSIFAAAVPAGFLITSLVCGTGEAAAGAYAGSGSVPGPAAVSDATASIASGLADAGFFGINAERPHEDVYNSDAAVSPADPGDSYSVEATVQIHETSMADASAGIIVRAASSGGLYDDDLYYFGVYPNEDRWKFWAPGFDLLQQGDYPVDLSPQSYHLKVVVTPSLITFYINGAAVGSSADAARTAGAAGIRLRATDTDFSDVRVNGALQDLASWRLNHAVAWSAGAAGASHGDVLLDPSLLASPQLSPQLDARFRMLSEMGASSVRFLISWAEVQPQDATQPYSWRYADAFAILAHKYGLEIAPVTEFAPRWAVQPEFRKSNIYQAYPPVDASGNFDTTNFAQFVAAAAQRYRRGGDLATQMGWSDVSGQATSFEVGPEFNMGTVYSLQDGQWYPSGAGWLGTLPQFVDLLKAGHDAVKSACPSCLVLNGAATDDSIPNYYIGDDPARHDAYTPYLGSQRLKNPDGTDAWRQTVWQGVNDLYNEIASRPAPDNDPGRYFDILNIHVYMWKGLTASNPDTEDSYVRCSYGSADCWRQWYKTRIANVLGVSAAHGDSRDLWLTEAGFATAPAPGAADNFLGHLTEDDQARALKAVYETAAGFPQVKKAFWWQGYDADYTGNLGLIREDLTGKPSYAAFAGMTGRTVNYNASGGFPWYDNQEAADWVLLANPAGAAGDASFGLSIGGQAQPPPALPGQPPGRVPPGAVLSARYPGLMAGPVSVPYAAGSEPLVSQRTLWAGSSLEEVNAGDYRLSSLLYWSWYDELSPDYQDWVIVSNPGASQVYYLLTIAGRPMAAGPIPAEGYASLRFPGMMGGPVSVQAWFDAVGGVRPADVLAAQRVLASGGAAFNEAPGIPASGLDSDYLWTWYDMKSPGASDWMMIANPPGAAGDIYYQITIGRQSWRGGPIAPGGMVTPEFPGVIGGPVEVKTFADASLKVPAASIAEQRSLWGPSFEETPGYPHGDLDSIYHWTWYDMLSSGVRNWVLIANPAGAAGDIYYQIRIGASVVQAGGPIAPGGDAAPMFPGAMGGPVEVRTFSDPDGQTPAPSLASQRVLWGNFFNEVAGTPLW